MSLLTLQNFYKETITVACTTGATNIYVSTKPTPTTGYLVISPGNELLREIVKYTGTGTDGTGDYVTIASASHRGLGGTTNQAHSIGEKVRMNYTAEHHQEASDAIDQIVAAGAQDASTTTKGIAKLSTAPVSASNPIAVGDNDPRLNATTGLTADKESFISAITGMLFMYGASSAPTGFLLCNGQAISRTTYANLFAVISTTYGVGDGSTTFNVPNLLGRFPLGYSASAPTKVLTFASRTSNVITITGADNHANNEIQTGQAVLYSAPSGAMTGLTDNTTYYLIRVSATTFSLATSVANANAGTAIALSSDGTGTQTFTLTYTARSLGHTGGEETHALTDAELPSHSHTLTSFKTNTAASAPRHTTDGNSAASTASTDVTGSDTPHNIMPLFTVVNYIIKT